MSSQTPMDRRSDVGSKMFLGIVTALLSAVFLGTLGISIRATEMNYMQETKIALLEGFAQRQDKLNDKLEQVADRFLMQK